MCEVVHKLRRRLNASRSTDFQHINASQAAQKTIREADNAYLNNLNILGDILARTATFLIDIATDVIPITSVPKDTYRALVGKDPVTGEALSKFERVLAVGFVVAAFGTVGLSNAAKLTFKEAEAVIHASEQEARLAEGITRVIKGSPLRVEVLTKGTSGEFAVIGRDMTRANEVGTTLRNEGIEVKTLDEFTKAANAEWEQMLIDYVKKPGDRIPPEIVKTSIRFSENQKWIRDALEKGHAIIDLGNPMAKEFSAFYEMEKGIVLEYIKKASKW
jgi:hypothetical protein